MLSIIIPPVSDCFMPTLGAAQLAGYLKQKNIDTKLYDLSAELQTVLLQEGSKLSIPLPEKDKSSTVHRYAAITRALFDDNITHFKLSYDFFSSSWDWREPDNLTGLLSVHKALLPFIDAIPSIPELECSTYAAFSISFESQLIPSLLIAERIRRNTNIRIIFGGSFFYNYLDACSKLMSTLDIIDCIIVGPGENILEAIGRDGIDNAVLSGHFSVGNIMGRTLLRLKAGERCPVVYHPDFTDLDFNLYFSSVHAFPFMIRNTCYYGSCRFCNGDRDCGTVQSKSVRKAFLSMSQIADECDVHNVYIVDAGLSPYDFKIISSTKTLIPFSWIANARFEKELDQIDLLREIQCKGCRMLRFGLESGSQRVLNLMNKGTNVQTAASILKKLHTVGILTHVYLMFGYYGETKEDRAETVRFLEQNRSYIDSYSVSIFQPIPGTVVYEEVKKKLCLPSKCNASEEYQQILAEIYPSECEYQDILNTIEQVQSVLAGYSHTNAEFYSANIFAEELSSGDEEKHMSIQFMPL